MSTILLLGTGSFAARIAFDLAAAARAPVRVVVAGRNGARLAWVRTGSNGRASIFGTEARFETEVADLMAPGVAEGLLRRVRPAVVVQAASVQAGNVISDRSNAWSRLVAEGGLSVTAPIQAVLSARVAGAVRDAAPGTAMVNCCFPDVVNPMLAGMGLPVTCGTGNVGILSNAFSGSLAAVGAGPVRMLAHYQNLVAWRQPPETRQGTAPRVWVEGTEVADVFGRFRDVRLSVEPALDLSGACGVPLMLAMAAGHPWMGHVPGPLGLPGGYPVRWDGAGLALDLPAGLSPTAAVAWNAAFEEANGAVLEGNRVRYTGRLRETLRGHGSGLAEGFDLSGLREAAAETEALRTRLQVMG